MLLFFAAAWILIIYYMCFHRNFGWKPRTIDNSRVLEYNDKYYFCQQKTGEKGLYKLEGDKQSLLMDGHIQDMCIYGHYLYVINPGVRERTTSIG